MALKEGQIRNLRPKAAIFQCTDERGLYLAVHPNGSKFWRYKISPYRKTEAPGLDSYPEVSLGDARRRRDNPRRKVEGSDDPLAERRREKLVAAFNAANSFGDIAKDYIERWSPRGRRCDHRQGKLAA